MPSTLHPLFLLLPEPLPDGPPFAPPLRAGAVVRFEGIVRDNNDGKNVVELEYSAYVRLAEREGARIVRESMQRFGLLAACCAHRTGVLHPGDVAVRVWSAAAHRREAFLACELIIDTVKASVPIWKRESYDDGTSAWVACDTCAESPPHESRHQ